MCFVSSVKIDFCTYGHVFNVIRFCYTRRGIKCTGTCFQAIGVLEFGLVQLPFDIRLSMPFAASCAARSPYCYRVLGRPFFCCFLLLKWVLENPSIHLVSTLVFLVQCKPRKALYAISRCRSCFSALLMLPLLSGFLFAFGCFRPVV